MTDFLLLAGDAGRVAIRSLQAGTETTDGAGVSLLDDSIASRKVYGASIESRVEYARSKNCRAAWTLTVSEDLALSRCMADSDGLKPWLSLTIFCKGMGTARINPRAVACLKVEKQRKDAVNEH